MAAKTVDTIIVGAGISGLACAKRLEEFDKDFLIISKEVGGRILTSEDGSVNYGAFFVCSDYHHVLQHVKLHSRIKLSDFCFHENDVSYPLFEPRLLLYLYQFMKIRKLLYRFRKSIQTFRKNAETTSQKTVIESDPFLYDLYKKTAVDLIREYAIEQGTDRYLSKALYSTTFSSIHEMNAFHFLLFLMPLITPIYTFIFEKEKMISPFQDKIIHGSVSDVCYSSGKYAVKAKKSTYYAKNLVLATEIGWSKKLAGVTKINKSVSTNMLHVRGTPKRSIAKKKYHLFSHSSMVQGIADLQDGSYLFYYKNKQPSLERFFTNPEVIAHHFWGPAGRINGHFLIDSFRGNNMFLIGDYNVAGLEEAFITGIFAANQIINI